MRTALALPLVTVLLAGAPAAQGNPVQLSIGAVNTVTGKLDIYMANSVPVTGFQFTLKDQAGAPLALVSGSGGTAELANFSVFAAPTGIALGFSFAGTSIPPSGGAHQIMTTLDFTGLPKDVCLSDIVIADTSAAALGVDVGPCVNVLAPVDCNENGIDDGTDIFQGSSLDLDGDGTPDECLEMIALPDSISLSSGGTQTFRLNAGVAHAGEFYLVVGSLSGTSPGTPVPPFVLPLNPDAYFLLSINSANLPPFSSTFALLDATGLGIASLTIPAGAAPGLAGTTAHHAFVALDAATLAPALVSNAAPLSLTP